MAPKRKTDATVINHMLSHSMDLNHIPLASKNYKIVETECEFDLFELDYWFRDNHLDQ